MTLLGFLLVSCANVTVKDNEWCGDLGILGADCFNSFSNNERSVSKSQWDKERFGMLCTKSSSFTNWKAAIMALCQNTGQCTYEVQDKVLKLDYKVKRFEIKKNIVTKDIKDGRNSKKTF